MALTKEQLKARKERLLKAWRRDDDGSELLSPAVKVILAHRVDGKALMKSIREAEDGVGESFELSPETQERLLGLAGLTSAEGSAA